MTQQEQSDFLVQFITKKIEDHRGAQNKMMTQLIEELGVPKFVRYIEKTEDAKIKDAQSYLKRFMAFVKENPSRKNTDQQTSPKVSPLSKRSILSGAGSMV